MFAARFRRGEVADLKSGAGAVSSFLPKSRIEVLSRVPMVLSFFYELERRYPRADQARASFLYRGITVLDDFAHHPTVVAATLAAVRQGYPKRRLVAVFEPRTNTSRRAIFQAQYAQAFGDADLIIVREPPDLWKAPEDDRFSSAQLTADLTSRGKQAFAFPDTDQLLAGTPAPPPPG